MQRIQFFIFYLGQHKLSYSFGIIFIVLTNWLAVTIPEYIEKSVDILSLGAEKLSSSQVELESYLWIIFILAVSIIFTRSLSRVLFFNPGRAIEFEVKNDLFQKLTYLQKDYYDKNPTGGIVSRIQNDITGVRLLCGFVMMQIFNIITALSLTPYKMWQLSPSLTLYCVAPVVAAFLIVKVGMKVVVVHSRTRQDLLQDISSYIVASLGGIDVIRAYQLTGWSALQFEDKNQEFLSESLKISFVRSFLIPILANLENILKILILFVGGYYVIESTMTIGQLTAFMAYSVLLTMPLMGLGWITTIIQQSMVGVESIESILSKEEPTQNIAPIDQKATELFEGGIEVKGLSYTYPDQTQPVLTDINFKIDPCKTIGILGPIGSGKTTLVNCLNGYLPTKKGEISLGGKDITEIPRQDLRQVVKTVSQDAFLFSDTLKNNIIFGAVKEDISPENLDRSIYESALQEEVERFPKGVETMVGEKGIMLSGGQKQRISLARAMVESAPLLVLDNVLSAVDYATERFLLGQILKRDSCQSLLIVSHRVQALENCDEILVLQGGVIVDRGTHSELTRRAGLYQQTWELQQGDHHEG